MSNPPSIPDSRADEIEYRRLIALHERIASQSETEYRSLREHFERMVKYFGIGVGLVGTLLIGAGGYLFHRSLSETEQDAKGELMRVRAETADEIKKVGTNATETAKAEAHRAIEQQFERTNIETMIEKAAQQKVAGVTDRIIDEHIATRIQPYDERFAMVARITDQEVRARLGFRDAMDHLRSIAHGSKDTQTAELARSIMDLISADYELRAKDWAVPYAGNQPTMEAVLGRAVGQSEPVTLSQTVNIIQHSQDLNGIAFAFVVLRLQSREAFKMFDFDGVREWCAKNAAICKPEPAK